MAKKHSLIPVEQIEKAILTVRRQRVILDADLAAIYGVTTARFNQQVRRNLDRFPEDFAYQLKQREFALLMLRKMQHQERAAKDDENRRMSSPSMALSWLPMCSTAPLPSRRAFFIIRASCGCEMLSTHADLARKIDDMENKYDAQFKTVFDAIRQLMRPPQTSRRQIGFHTKPDQRQAD